jgi:hypothetical protein
MILPSAGVSLPATRTSVFLYATLAQLAFTYPARRIGSPPVRNPALHLAVALCCLVQLATVFAPGLRQALGLVPLDTFTLAATAAAVATTWAVAEMIARVLRRQYSSGAHGAKHAPQMTTA